MLLFMLFLEHLRPNLALGLLHKLVPSAQAVLPETLSSSLPTFLLRCHLLKEPFFPHHFIQPVTFSIIFYPQSALFYLP